MLIGKQKRFEFIDQFNVGCHSFIYPLPRSHPSCSSYWQFSNSSAKSPYYNVYCIVCVRRFYAVIISTLSGPCEGN